MPLPNQTAQILWDGLDYLGRPAYGRNIARVSVGFIYNGYYSVRKLVYRKSFGKWGYYYTTIPVRVEMPFWKNNELDIYHMGSQKAMGEGWSLSVHHQLSPSDISTLYKGDGTINSNDVSLIETAAGTGSLGYLGDGGPATEARLRMPTGIATDSEGSFYLSDLWKTVRKVDTAGIITTVAGGNYFGYSGDGGPATEARLYEPAGIAVDAHGNIFIADRRNHRIREVDTDGIITTVAGNGQNGYSGDEGTATGAQLSYPRDVAVDVDSNIYIADTANNRIRKVDPSGMIITVVGTGAGGYSGDDGPAINAKLYSPWGVAMNPAGNLYIADWGNQRIRKVTSIPESLADLGSDIFFAEEGGVAYGLTGSGYHMNTVDLDTGTVLREFVYDEENRLVFITDLFGNQTVVDRNSEGVPVSITSPDGIITELTIDGDNHLSRIEYPDGAYWSFEYTSDGLITAKVEPEGNRFEYIYNSEGIVTGTLDEEGGNWQFSESDDDQGNTYSETLTAEGNLTTYVDHTDATGAYISTITDPTGSETLFIESSDGLTTTKSLPCGMELRFEYGTDPEYRFKYIKEISEESPSGLLRADAKIISHS